MAKYESFKLPLIQEGNHDVLNRRQVPANYTFDSKNVLVEDGRIRKLSNGQTTDYSNLINQIQPHLGKYLTDELNIDYTVIPERFRYPLNIKTIELRGARQVLFSIPRPQKSVGLDQNVQDIYMIREEDLQDGAYDEAYLIGYLDAYDFEVTNLGSQHTNEDYERYYSLSITEMDFGRGKQLIITPNFSVAYDNFIFSEEGEEIDANNILRIDLTTSRQDREIDQIDTKEDFDFQVAKPWIDSLNQIDDRTGRIDHFIVNENFLATKTQNGFFFTRPFSTIIEDETSFYPQENMLYRLTDSSSEFPSANQYHSNRRFSAYYNRTLSERMVYPAEVEVTIDCESDRGSVFELKTGSTLIAGEGTFEARDTLKLRINTIKTNRSLDNIEEYDPNAKPIVEGDTIDGDSFGEVKINSIELKAHSDSLRANIQLNLPDEVTITRIVIEIIGHIEDQRRAITRIAKKQFLPFQTQTENLLASGIYRGNLFYNVESDIKVYDPSTQNTETQFPNVKVPNSKAMRTFSNGIVFINSINPNRPLIQGIILKENTTDFDLITFGEATRLETYDFTNSRIENYANYFIVKALNRSTKKDEYLIFDSNTPNGAFVYETTIENGFLKKYGDSVIVESQGQFEEIFNYIASSGEESIWEGGFFSAEDESKIKGSQFITIGGEITNSCVITLEACLENEVYYPIGILTIDNAKIEGGGTSINLGLTSSLTTPTLETVSSTISDDSLKFPFLETFELPEELRALYRYMGFRIKFLGTYGEINFLRVDNTIFSSSNILPQETNLQ